MKTKEDGKSYENMKSKEEEKTYEKVKSKEIRVQNEKGGAKLGSEEVDGRFVYIWMVWYLSRG